MSARYFLDTNIVVYSLDPDTPKKQAVARALIERALSDKEGCISTQVVQESLSLLTSKFKHLMTANEAREYLKMVLDPLCLPFPSLPLYRRALDIQERWKFHFYDALIVAGALALDCERLYTEDMRHNRRIEGLTVVNPFADVTLTT